MAINPVSYAVAHSITERVSRTWFSALHRTPRVLVPVHLEALMVRQAGAPWASCAMKQPVDGGPAQDISKLLPDPFTNLPTPRPRGAYLHWALPDALTRGSQTRKKNADGTETSEIQFPAIPDRWLVVRLFPSIRIPNRRAVRGWVLEAHDADPKPTELDSWTEKGVAPEKVKKPLTALGFGDTSWSAYYDNVVNRMGFYDSLSDVANGPIAYLVCGWYSDQSFDPLGDPAIRSLTDFDAKMNELRWVLPEKDFKKAASKSKKYMLAADKIGLATTLSIRDRQRAMAAFDERPLTVQESAPKGPPFVTDGSWWPNHTLFHGSVLGIGWPGIGWPGNENGVLSGEEGGPPASSTVQVAIGNTMAETLAALVAKKNNSVKDARILEAFQQNSLGELNEADGRARLDTRLHASAFGSTSGGVVKERVFRPESGTPPPPPSRNTKVGAGVFQRFDRATTTKLAEAALPQPKVTNVTVERKTVSANVFRAASVKGETQIAEGRLGYVMSQVAPQVTEPFKPGRWEDVLRPQPRLFHPSDPIVLVQGLKRSFQFGHDGQFSADGKLMCRITGTCIDEYVQWHGDISYPPLYPDDVLDRGIENGSVPPECEELLGEVALLDPGSSAPIATKGTGGTLNATLMKTEVQRVMVEQTALWATRDPRVDHGPLLSRSSFSGLLPSPVALTPPKAPWSPLHLEWRIEFIPSANGQKDWKLGEADYDEQPALLPPSSATGIILEGRSVLTAGANNQLAQAVRKAIDEISRSGGSATLPAKNQILKNASFDAGALLSTVASFRVATGVKAGGVDRSDLEDIATALESMDVLAAGFDGMHTRLRGGFLGDGIQTKAVGDPLPAPFFAMRAGFLRIRRLRLVDCFGQFVDLAGSSASKDVNPQLLLHTPPLDVTGRNDLLALPPRFTSPTRVQLRYMDAGGSAHEASLATDVSPGVSPICGYLMPNHLDAALGFYAADGADLGVVRPAGDGSIIWEDAPGRPSAFGQSPASSVSNPFLAGVAEGLIDWGITDAGFLEGPDTALEAMLRVIDSTMWSVDPYAHQGEDHLALLLGHPIVVMRALVRLEVKEPVAPDLANVERVPIRIGSLSHWQDGVFGFFVNDDFRRFYCSPAAAKFARQIGPGKGFLQQANTVQQHYDQFEADLGGNPTSPVTHPFVDTSGVLFLQPGQDAWLTLLVEPHSVVGVTAGIVPRKEAGMRREWVKDALSRLSPTFRFGPVLIDPKRIRMPIPHDINGTWSWDHRVDINTWSNDPITHATQDAILSPDPPTGSEGWLRLTPPKGENNG